MLNIVIPASEYFDESTNTFVFFKETRLQLEHSLVSISKWEAKWHKPFLDMKPKTAEECLDYIRCMTITQNVDPSVYTRIPADVFEKVNAYIEAPMTATWFSDKKKNGGSREVVTSEIIYYWMFSLNIPMECQKWHLNRLLTQIRVVNLKNAPQKKMSRKEIMSRNRALNAQRRQSLNSKG